MAGGLRRLHAWGVHPDRARWILGSLATCGLCYLAIEVRNRFLPCPDPSRCTIPDLRWTYTAEEVRFLLGAWGESGRRLYAATQLSVDLLLPISLGVALALLVVRGVRGHLGLALGMVPFVGVLADLVENGILAAAALADGGAALSLVPLACGATRLKWVAFLGAATVGIGAEVLARWRRR